MRLSPLSCAGMRGAKCIPPHYPHHHRQATPLRWTAVEPHFIVEYHMCVCVCTNRWIIWVMAPMTTAMMSHLSRDSVWNVCVRVWICCWQTRWWWGSKKDIFPATNNHVRNVIQECIRDWYINWGRFMGENAGEISFGCGGEKTDEIYDNYCR